MARVGFVPISVHQIVRHLKSMGTDALRRYTDRERLRQLVEDRIRFELLVRAALERDLARDPEVVEAARTVMVRKLLQRDLGPTLEAGDLPEERLRKYYDQHLDDYLQPEKRRFAHIQLAPTEAGRAQAQGLIDQLTARPQDDAFFHQLARRHSRDRKSRERGGEMPYLAREALIETFGPSFADTVFRVTPNSLVPEPVQSIRGWHVLTVASHREALARSFEEVRGDIRERLLSRRRAKDFDHYLSELRRRYPVALYEDRLDDILVELNQLEAKESR